MPYALGRVVNIWMGLYYNLPRIKLWAREKEITPTIDETLDYLAEQQYRAGEKSLYYKMRSIFRRLRENQCNHAVSALETAWKNAISSNDVVFSSPVTALSLYDFPRFMGASWPHNDIALYIPDLKKTAVMKVSDSRFEPLREKLMVWSHGLDPFIGTTFTIEHSKLQPVFNRIRCTRALPINQNSLHMFATYKEQMNKMEGAYISPSDLRNVLEGNAPLDLEKFIIARYGSGYALMQFVLSDAVMTDATKYKDWNHYIKLDVDGAEFFAWMSRDALFDSITNPIGLINKKVRIGGFVLIGRSAIEDYVASIHLMSIFPADQFSAIAPITRNGTSLSLIKEVEDEMLALTEKMKREKEKELEAETEVQEELIKQEAPEEIKIKEIKESDFPHEQGRILVLLSSDRRRGFKFNEIFRRLHHEGLATTRMSVSANLESLCKQELLYLNIFGDTWFLNPSLKIHSSGSHVSPQSVEPRILEFLEKNYPRKIPRGEIIRTFCQEDSRLNASIVSKALGNLQKTKKAIGVKNKLFWNPYPPRDRRKKVEEERLPQKELSLLMLNEKQVEKIPDYLFVSEEGWVNIYRNNLLIRKILVRRVDSRDTLKQLISYIKKGTYTSFDFEDHKGGYVKISMKDNVLVGAYTIVNKHLAKEMSRKLQ